MSVDTGTNEAPAPAAPPAGGRGHIVRILVLVFVLLVAGAGIQRWLWSQTHITSDNAQIEGDVVPCVTRVGGYVAEIKVVENQVLKPGDLLVQLDDREQRAKLAQAEADYAGALATAGEKGHVGQSEAQLAAARAQVAQADANAIRARADVERYRTLAARNIVSRQQLDGAVAANDAAVAALDAARKQVQAAEAALQGAGAKLLSARASRQQADLQLGYTRITAPIGGVASKVNVDPGQYLQAGQSILAIVPLDDIHVVANLKETQLEHVRPGDTVEIDVDAYPHHAVHGVVESFSPATGAKFSLLPPDNATGNYTHVVQHLPVRIRITDRGAPERPLRPGMSVQIVITTRKG